MQTASGNLKFQNGDSTWHLLAECSIGVDDFGKNPGVKLSIGSLIDTMRKLGLPPKTLHQIEGTITRIANEALSHIYLGRPILPVYIRLFCERKTIDQIPLTEAHMNGGWGYYLIERVVELSPDYFKGYRRVIELYLYSEINSIEAKKF